jgi:glycine/D-amino acid oxidase-like deaminating enzyme
VEPRLALPALRASLAGPGYAWLPGTEAVEVAGYGVRDQFGTWHRGDLIVLCTGANFTGVAGPHLSSSPHSLRRVRLQMLQTAPFPGRLTTSVADGDSLRYYPAYDHLRARAEALLGTALPRVQRRWAGVYSEVTGTSALYHRSEVAPGVVLVTGPGGRGMTCSPAIAEETFLS